MGVQRSEKRSGFTMIEMMTVVVIVAIITVAALPDAGAAAKEEGRHAAEMFEGDVSYARSLSIAQPGDPVIIKVDVDNNRYWLARQITPDTPIAHPRTGLPYLRSFGSVGDAGLQHVAILGQDFDGDAILGFDAMGGLDQDAEAILQFTASGASYEISVAPVTANATTRAELTTNLAEG